MTEKQLLDMQKTSSKMPWSEEDEKRLLAASLLLKTIKKSDWQSFLSNIFPQYLKYPFAQRHIELWEWIDAIEKDIRPRPFVAGWPRGGAKSTTAELGIVYLAHKRKRNYCWYVSSTQQKADQHVSSIASLLESSSLERYDRDLSNRLTGKYGSSKGWRRERLRTSSGFTVDAFGMDVGVRGGKIDQYRPDIIILDDIDEASDTIATTLKKQDIITDVILPAGSPDCAVLFIQNAIHPESICSRLFDGRADYLADRIISGLYPAIINPIFEQRDGRYFITDGVATWEGQNLALCQNYIDTWGYTAFKKEAQHEVKKRGGIWDDVDFQHITYNQLPKFVRNVVWVDPAVTATDQSDCQGIAAGGVTIDDILIGLYWWEGIEKPLKTIKKAIRKAIEIKALEVGIETDQGGDTWDTVYEKALAEVKEEMKKELSENEYNIIIWPKFKSDKAGRGYGSKAERNSRLLATYERGKVKHMTGTHNVIEEALWRFPNAPLDVQDAWWWVANDLIGGQFTRMYSTKV